VAVGALLTVLAASCGSGSDAEPADSDPSSTEPADTTAASTPTTEPPATTTTAPATTTEPSAATTTAPPAPTTTVVPACPQAPPPPAEATDATSVSADFDADGLADTLSTYLVPFEARWHVRVEFGAGGSDDASIADSDMVAPARPIGGHDVNGDGTLEAFVTVGSGASAVLVGLYDVAACGLTRITVGADPAVFPIGATVGNVSGLSCNGVGDLDRVFAQQVGPDEYEGGFEPYSLAGSVLTAGFGDGAGFTADEAAALATLDCGGLTLP
jgi:hypothetical protein